VSDLLRVQTHAADDLGSGGLVCDIDGARQQKLGFTFWRVIFDGRVNRTDDDYAADVLDGDEGLLPDSDGLPQRQRNRDFAPFADFARRSLLTPLAGQTAPFRSLSHRRGTGLRWVIDKRVLWCTIM
jgi:hypothetical protein